MSAQAKTLEDLKDSRIMFDKEIPPFGYMLVLIVFFTMAGITVWSTFAHKAYMVRAEGSITSSDSNYVMPFLPGRLPSPIWRRESWYKKETFFLW